MIQIDKTLVSEDIIEKDFVCNLNICKGQCCIDGDAGAPLEKEELEILKDIFPKIKQYLSKEGLETIKKQGLYTISQERGYETTLINNTDCVYVIYNDKNVALCAIEEAYNQGEIKFKKPVSCHLYPIRVQKHTEFLSVNYDKWSICNDACILGKELQIPIYKFVKQALIRKFGETWYIELEKTIKSHNR